ncbi:MAG: hypothetical protein H3C45_10575 [Bacteroidia bacterium]|nr:hypothetical protein [Bacteroidia bacterium]MCC7534539.1 hypothetical protein [Bacteroidia bacterium]
MKKHVLILVAFAFSILAVHAQIKEGSITYSMKFEGMSKEESAMMGDMKLVSTFKNGNTRTEMSSLAFKNINVMNSEGFTMLMESMGNKMALKQSKEELKKFAESKVQLTPKIEYTNEKKTIAGYECKKAIVSFVQNNVEEKMVMWYSDKFINPNIEGDDWGQSFMKGLKGLPFEYSMQQGNMKFSIEATAISTAPVDDKLFKVSTDGYRLISMQELEAMQGN